VVSQFFPDRAPNEALALVVQHRPHCTFGQTQQEGGHHAVICENIALTDKSCTIPRVKLLQGTGNTSKPRRKRSQAAAAHAR
jgi:hypothetical protein